jgi:hypothetical protein
MQLARFDRILGLLLVLGCAGFLGGCGWGAKQVSPDEDKAAGKAIEADMRKFYQGLKAKKAEGTGGPRRKGRGPG